MQLKAGDTLAAIVDRIGAEYPANEAIISGEQRIDYKT